MKYDRTDIDWHWGHEARCKGADVELFFPPRDKEKYKVIANQAKDYCFGTNRRNPCPVQKYCLWDAVQRDELHGIWGGMSHRERNAVVRRWKRNYSDTMDLKTYIFSDEV